jgi:myo-inositol-1-phosphate synthase
LSTTPDSASADVQKPTPKIAPANGKLGILIPGMGAVTTTFIAGVEAIKQGIAKPIGSVTQLSTIRLGKRTDNNTPKIKDFVPLAPIEDLEFGGWDIFEENCYEAAVHAGVLDRPLVEQLKEPLEKIKPMKAVFDQRIREAHQRPQQEAEGFEDGARRDADGRHPEFKESPGCDRLAMIWCGSTEVFHRPPPFMPPSKISNAGCRRTIRRFRPARFTPTPR